MNVSASPKGYNIISNKNYDYLDNDNYQTDQYMNRKHNIDFPDHNKEEKGDKFKEKEFLNEYHFKDLATKSPPELWQHDESIVYKTKDLPNCLQEIFSDQSRLSKMVEVVKTLTRNLLDYRVLNQVKIGFQ